MLLQPSLPGEHRRVHGGPHAGIPAVQLFDSRWGQAQSSIVDQLFPEAQSGEFALVVGMAIGPVEALKAFSFKSGDAHHFRVRMRIRRPGEYHSEVEDYRAQTQAASQGPSPCMVEKDASLNIARRSRAARQHDVFGNAHAFFI